jgi:hypothetical protein
MRDRGMEMRGEEKGKGRGTNQHVKSDSPCTVELRGFSYSFSGGHTSVTRKRDRVNAIVL